jgi:hypothetical protein
MISASERTVIVSCKPPRNGKREGTVRAHGDVRAVQHVAAGYVVEVEFSLMVIHFQRAWRGSRAWGGSVLAVSAARSALCRQEHCRTDLVREVFAGPHHPGRENEDESDGVQALAPESI